MGCPRFARNYSPRIFAPKRGVSTNTMIKNIINPAFEGIIERAETYPRICGYYILGLVDISGCRLTGMSDSDITNLVVDYFHDDPRWIESGSTLEGDWDGYERSEEIAINHLLSVLVGGGPIGHSRDDMPREIALEIVDLLKSIFNGSNRYLIDLDIGDRSYVFNHGVLVLSEKMAGLVYVVESD